MDGPEEILLATVVSAGFEWGCRPVGAILRARHPCRKLLHPLPHCDNG